MEKPFCVGEDECEYMNKPKASGDAAAASRVSVLELKMNTIVVQEDKQDQGDPMTQWMGVYCPHYQRFFCTGGADGCKSGSCANADAYHKALADHMETLK